MADATNNPQDQHRQVTITIGADGRVYFHDLTPELVSVAAILNPQSPEIQGRRTAGNLLTNEGKDEQPADSEKDG